MFATKALSFHKVIRKCKVVFPMISVSRGFNDMYPQMLESGYILYNRPSEEIGVWVFYNYKDKKFYYLNRTESFEEELNDFNAPDYLSFIKIKKGSQEKFIKDMYT